jgi:asparagine synthase (glutamine-hydrolysing)
MAHGLEARAPLLDRHVVALARALPPALSARLPWESKRTLKTVFRDLIPPAIARRPKMGFGVPVGAWLRGPLRTLAHDVLRSERCRGRGIVPADVVDRLLLEHDRGREHGRKLYALLAMEAWFRQFIDPVRPERVGW